MFSTEPVLETYVINQEESIAFEKPVWKILFLRKIGYFQYTVLVDGLLLHTHKYFLQANIITIVATLALTTFPEYDNLPTRHNVDHVSLDARVTFVPNYVEYQKASLAAENAIQMQQIPILSITSMLLQHLNWIQIIISVIK